MNKTQILKLAYEYAETSLEPKEFVPGTTKVPVSGAVLSPTDVSELVDAVLEFWYTEGKFCARFKRRLMDFTGKEYVTLCNSGSSATLLAMSVAAERLPQRKYVITCATHFPTSIAPIYQTGQIPIYVDVIPETLFPDLNQVYIAHDKYENNVSSTAFAHILGFPFDDVVFNIFGSGFRIEDCCDALGANVFQDEGLPIHVGKYSDLMTLSFFPAHHITSGEGGAVLTNSKLLHDILESFANWGRSCYCAPGQSNTCGKRFDWETEFLPASYDHKYIFDRLGYNFKMTEWQAALGNSQLSRANEFIETRRKNFVYYCDNLPLGEELRTVRVPIWSNPSPFGFPILVNSVEFTATQLINYLEERKIATRRVFAGNITKQPGYAHLPYITVGELTGSDRVMNDMFWIGCHPQLTQPMMDYVVEVFHDFMDAYE